MQFRTHVLPLTNLRQPKEDKMKPQVLGLRVAGSLFGIMALIHVGRLVIRPEILIAGHPAPMWPSVLALIVLGGLSGWMWKLSRSSTG